MELNLQSLQQVQVIPEAENGITTRSVTELAFYMFGLFIVQTIVTVLVMRSGDAEKNTKNEKKDIKELNVDVHVNVKKDIIIPDESQYIGKIAEIRAMAKEVRERERKNSSVVEYEDDVSVVSKVKGNIEKEVDVKLSKLERRFRSLNETNGKKNVGSLNSKVKNEKLVFKKKMKFKTAPFNLTSDPKGFPSGNSRNVINGNGVAQSIADSGEADGDDVLNDGLLEITPEKEETMLELDSGKNDNDLSSKKMGSTNEVRRKPVKETKSSENGEMLNIDKSKSKSRIARKSSSKRVESKDASELKKNTSPTSRRHNEHKQVVKKSEDKQASGENEMWWLNLRYVLDILLRTSSESEGPGGFYSLKMEGSPSYLVAFEDQVDASNFCCILDVFFAELGDIIADVVPLSIQELRAELEDNDLKVIVARKGQLQLYAGQPLAEVEMTLRSLVRKGPV